MIDIEKAKIAFKNFLDEYEDKSDLGFELKIVHTYHVAENAKKILVSESANVTEFKELGEKKLAYPIKKEINGYYYVLQVEANKEAITEFDRKVKLDENILRHLIIRLDEE